MRTIVPTIYSNDPQDIATIRTLWPDAKEARVACPDCFGLNGEHLRASCSE